MGLTLSTKIAFNAQALLF